MQQGIFIVELFLLCSWLALVTGLKPDASDDSPVANMVDHFGLNLTCAIAMIMAPVALASKIASLLEAIVIAIVTNRRTK